MFTDNQGAKLKENHLDSRFKTLRLRNAACTGNRLSGSSGDYINEEESRSISWEPTTEIFPVEHNFLNKIVHLYQL